MNGKQFINSAKIWGKAAGVTVTVESSRVKGGHQILRVGDKWTTVPTGELKPGVFHAMLKQLGVAEEDF